MLPTICILEKAKLWRLKFSSCQGLSRRKKWHIKNLGGSKTIHYDTMVDIYNRIFRKILPNWKRELGIALSPWHVGVQNSCSASHSAQTGHRDYLPDCFPNPDVFGTQRTVKEVYPSDIQKCGEWYLGALSKLRPPGISQDLHPCRPQAHKL